MHGRGSCDWKNGAFTSVKFQSPSTCPNFQGIRISLQCKLVFKAANFLYTKQSSANNLTRLLIQTDMSLIYGKTRRGPSTVPCGTLSQCSHRTIHCSDFFYIFLWYNPACKRVAWWKYIPRGMHSDVLYFTKRLSCQPTRKQDILSGSDKWFYPFQQAVFCV